MPFASEPVAMLSGGLLIVIVRILVAEAPALSVTLKVTEVGPPAVVGAPEITPLALSDNPSGKAPEMIDQVKMPVPPVAVKV